MKKVAVLTRLNMMNYGGTLQAVALSRALRKIGMESVYIRHQGEVGAWNSIRDYLGMRKQFLGKLDIRALGGCAKILASNMYILDRKKKIESFTEFRKTNLTMSKICLTYPELEPFGDIYDGYITGSDQVWNNNFETGNIDYAYFLKFVDPSKPCFSYAASAGGKKSDDYIKEIVELTKGFRGISVRENSLAEAMTAMGAKNVKTVLDPTLLFSGKEWKELERRPSVKVPAHYILVYYLERDTYDDPIINAVRKGTGLPVIDLNPSRLRSSSGVHADRKAGPREFLYWFSHADYVVTNSFHAVSFSLIFHRRFVACQRPGQESRIEDLLRSINLENRIIYGPEEWKIIYEGLPKKYDNFAARKAESYEFLKQIREIVEEE